MRLAREKTEEEKAEFKDLHEKTAETYFMDKMNRFAQAFVERHKPYCRKCAMEEFKMKKQTMYNEMKMRYKRDFTEKEKPFVDLADNFDLTKYGSSEHFTLIGTERKNIRRREGGDVWFELVVNKSFACKPYGHGCTVSIAQSEMNEEELAEENKRKAERHAKLGVTAPAESVPCVDDELAAKRLPPGTHTQVPTPSPAGNTPQPPVVVPPPPSTTPAPSSVSHATNMPQSPR